LTELSLSFVIFATNVRHPSFHRRTKKETLHFMLQMCDIFATDVRHPFVSQKNKKRKLYILSWTV
jgi:hypothetical protein